MVADRKEGVAELANAGYESIVLDTAAFAFLSNTLSNAKSPAYLS